MIEVDGGRLLRRIDELAAIGGLPGTRGCSRLALTDADRAGRDFVVTWMRDLGLEVAVDGMGNVVATMPGWDPDLAPVLTGSHIDTVATGGMALEEALEVRDRDGVSVGDELARIGYQGSGPCPARPPAAFVELHIEQGPVLDREGVTIGAVTGVQGISWTEVTLTGQSNHAGTTPMHLRHDPAYGAAEVAVEVRRVAQDLGGHQVGTVGSLRLHPDLVNVVAARATLTVDLRNTDEVALQEAEARVRARIDAVAREEGLGAATRRLARFEPVPFDDLVVDLVEGTAAALGHSCRRLPSGAGHDAQMLARVCPTGMVFVRSQGGISHNPAEHTEDDDVVAGANVLANVLLQLAEEV